MRSAREAVILAAHTHDAHVEALDALVDVLDTVDTTLARPDRSPDALIDALLEVRSRVTNALTEETPWTR